MTSRRATLAGLAALAAAPALAAVPTPRQSTGPFYPYDPARERDVDLTRVAGSAMRAQGATLRLSGRVLGPDGRPVRGAAVELWQANAWGRYSHPRDTRDAPLDPGFQGHGVAQTDAEGRYGFLTVKPGLYPGRTRHIHFAIRGPGFEPISTQMYFAGEPGNARDFLLNAVGDPQARESLIVDFRPAETDEDAELAGVFDIVLGR